MSKFKIGDRVRVINYGHLMWLNKNMEQMPGFDKHPIITETDDIKWIDVSPELIGRMGIVENVINKTKRPQYSINGIPGKASWYDEDQLEDAFENHHTIKRGGQQLMQHITHLPTTVFITIINDWWKNYKWHKLEEFSLNVPIHQKEAVAMTGFNALLKDTLSTTEIKLKYDMSNDKWMLHEKED